MDAQGPVGQPALSPSRPVALIRRVASPIWQRVGIAAVLEVRGRHSGRTLRVPLIPARLDGRLYLLAFGGVTDWARNLRAAGQGRLKHKGRWRAFKSAEVNGPERDRVIAAYLAGSGPVRKDFNRRPNAIDHPAFRVDPID